MINKTDLVFTGSVIGTVWSTYQAQIHSLINSNTYVLLGVLFGIISIVTYMYYEKLEGTVPPPLPPTPPTV